jgi:hypothetical protein
MSVLDRLTANPHPNDYDYDEIGTHDGETCGRYHEPDEDAPRGYRPKPCEGEMNLDEPGGTVCCDTCGEYVE